MTRLARTRSQQHYVASPRRVGSSLKHKASQSRLHIPKRRKVVAAGGAANEGATSALANQIVSPPPSEDEADRGTDVFDDDTDLTSASHSQRSKSSSTRSHGIPLDSQTGSQRANRRASSHVRGRTWLDGISSVSNDISGNSGNGSPRKRKRLSQVNTPRQGSPSPGNRSGSDTADSGSWVEMEDGEEKPEFMSESELHLRFLR